MRMYKKGISREIVCEYDPVVVKTVSYALLAFIHLLYRWIAMSDS